MLTPKLSLKEIEHYLFVFGFIMLIVSFLTLNLEISIVDVVGLVIYLVGNMKVLPGFLSSIAKFIGIMTFAIIGAIVLILIVMVAMLIL